MKDWMYQHKIYLIITVIIALMTGYYFFDERKSPSEINVEEVVLTDINGEEEAAQPPQNQIQEIKSLIVDVKGQVKMPGVYSTSQDERVIDVVQRAGGLTENADESKVNFAEHVQDAMVIYIPAKGEDGSVTQGLTTNPSETGGAKQGKINLNKAGEIELQNLPGIGPSKAAAIIEYRETNGLFKNVEDLKNISGIGDKTFDKLKDLITVQ
ncbi:helix-hairpin-helix domain-containing protein [Neobacillus niacini]|uniref:helix-hairpin-helix domain-containing protein n=1 Tax=Neobacillus niacini TaxID=86668 RepID=UPI0007ABBBA0|nr:helix-hairpin-helix domain-containing protein [Neobacillus niacini]MEC1522903.1 helix-hairpin-helix domain-containing protein [Neobacillus niacini]